MCLLFPKWGGGSWGVGVRPEIGMRMKSYEILTGDEKSDQELKSESLGGREISSIIWE